MMMVVVVISHVAPALTCTHHHSSAPSWHIIASMSACHNVMCNHASHALLGQLGSRGRGDVRVDVRARVCMCACVRARVRACSVRALSVSVDERVCGGATSLPWQTVAVSHLLSQLPHELPSPHRTQSHLR
jgi:hypothetical protein